MSTVLYKINKIKYELRNSFWIKYDGKPINHKVVKAQPKLNHFYLRCLVELWQDLWFSIQQFGKIILEVQAVVLRVVCQIDDSPLYVAPPILYRLYYIKVWTFEFIITVCSVMDLLIIKSAIFLTSATKHSKTPFCNHFCNFVWIIGYI